MDWKYAMLFALLLVPFVSAAPQGYGPGVQVGQGPGIAGKYMNGEGLASAMDVVVCRTDFTVGVLDSMIDRVPGASGLGDSVDELEEDTAQLQQYADAGDVDGFKTYLRGTYESHLRDAKQEVLEARRTANLSSDTRAELRADYDALRAEYDGCNFNGLKRAAQAKIDGYGRFLDRAEEKTNNLAGKGVETGGLLSLISDARSQIVAPLQSAVDAADNASEVKDAFGQYCLFNGCPDGTNFHFAAKFEIEKLDGILAVVGENATAAGLGADVDGIQADLDSAEAGLVSAGTDQFNDKQVWNGIRAASDGLRDLMAALRAS